MTQILPYSMQDQITALVVVFAFHFLTFRWAERSALVSTIYFVVSTALVCGPFVAAVSSMPQKSFSISDQVVVWTLLSYFVTMLGIALSAPARGAE